MRLDGELAAVQARASVLGLRVTAEQAWLVGGFLAEGVLEPRRYLARAEQHQVRQRQLLALTRRLLEAVSPRPAA